MHVVSSYYNPLGPLQITTDRGLFATELSIIVLSRLVVSVIKMSVGNCVDVLSACTFAVASQKLGK